jgi:beta-lactamase class A
VPAPTVAALETEFAARPGTVSVWCGPVGGASGATVTPAYTRSPDVPHYAASTMKVAVLVALHRAAEAGDVDLDAPVPVTNDFASAKPGAGRFAVDPAHDHDDEVWARVGRTATPRWLGRHMIVKSSNLATNVVMALTGTPAAGVVLRDAGATRSRVERAISDTAARDAGIDNEVTVRDLAALLGAIVAGAGPGNGPAPSRPMASSKSCAEMVDVLCAQQHRVDLAAGLPPGTRIAHKNGWVTGVRHSAGVVFPSDAPPYAIAVCTTSMAEPDDAAACALIAGVARASWADRHLIAAG